VKLLLTSGGISNPSIHAALLDLLGKPIEESSALCIPTASWGHPRVPPENVARFIGGDEPRAPMAGLGWKSVGVLELTALPSLDRERWLPWIDRTDVFLVDGGDAAYLAHWMRESGLADLLPSLTGKVWVGMSAGSMVMAPRIGDGFVHWQSPAGDRALGVVDFSIYPHLDNPGLPGNTIASAEAWAAGLDNRAYVIDDSTAIKVVEGDVEVVSEGSWTLL
jgi:dipeptidase E